MEKRSEVVRAPLMNIGKFHRKYSNEKCWMIFMTKCSANKLVRSQLHQYPISLPAFANENTRSCAQLHAGIWTFFMKFDERP